MVTVELVGKVQTENSIIICEYKCKEDINGVIISL